MTPDRPTPPPSRPGRTEPWRIERMIQKVPAHIDETPPESVSPWFVIAGAALLILVSCGVLFVFFNIPERLRTLGAVSQPTPTRTRLVTPAITILPTTIVVPPTSAPTAASVKYKVKSGDSLISIAGRYKVTVQALMAANGLKDDTIRIGDDLIIPLPTATPSSGGSAPQPAPGTTPTPVSYLQPNGGKSSIPPGLTRYSVVKGDTLVTIAAHFGSTVDAIRVANQMDSDFLQIGQVLSIPGASWAPTAVPTVVAFASATPTAQFAYSAPSLQYPEDKYTVVGSANPPVLEWLSPAILKPGEYYLVHIDYDVNGKRNSIVQTVRQSSYRLKTTDYPSEGGGQFSWYILIVSSNANAMISPQARADVQSSSLTAQSPPSEIRTFRWQ